MALDNIFMGKRVVQQAYLNNALLYQANGWKGNPEDYSETTLPSFSPNLDTFSSFDNLTYLEDDTLLLQFGSNSGYKYLVKLSLTGEVIWQTLNIQHTSYIRRELTPYLRGYKKGEKGSGILYVVTTRSTKYPDSSTTGNDFFIDSYNNATGALVSSFRLSTISGYDNTNMSLADVCFDENYIYMLFSSYYGTTYISKFTYDNREIVHLYKIDSGYGSSMALDASGKYLYLNVTSYSKLYKVDKTTFAIIDSFQPVGNDTNDNTYTDKYIIDSMNNLYFYATRQHSSSYNAQTFLKYSLTNKKLVYKYKLKSPSTSFIPYVIDAKVDKYYNAILYCVGSVPVGNGGWGYYIIKLDPNGNMLWAKVYDGSLGDGTGGITVTNQGTIYYCCYALATRTFNFSKILGLKKLTNSAIV